MRMNQATTALTRTDLLRARVVVLIDPVHNHPTCEQRALEAVPVYALVLELANHMLCHPILLGAVGGDCSPQLLTRAV